MFHNNEKIVAKETVVLAQKLMSEKILAKFNLVGGTALALQIGHRNSIDLDFFTTEKFDENGLINFLIANYNFNLNYKSSQTIIGIINNIKVDFITHPYPLLKPTFEEEKIRMVSKEDICAMKLNAISNSGQRLKDFIDIYYLLEDFSTNEMLKFYKEKYQAINPIIALRALNFFDDIDLEIDPPKLLKPLPIEKIKKRINKAVINGNLKF